MSEINTFDAYLESLADKANQAKAEYHRDRAQDPDPQPKTENVGEISEKQPSEDWSEVEKVVRSVFERAVLEQKRAEKRSVENTAVLKDYADLAEYYESQGKTDDADAALQDFARYNRQKSNADDSAKEYGAFLQRGKDQGLVSDTDITQWSATADEKIRQEEADKQAEAARIVEEKRVIAEATKEMERSIEELNSLREQMLKNKKWEPSEVLQQVDDIKDRLNLIGKGLGMDWQTLLHKIPNGVNVLFAIQVIEVNAKLGKD